MKSFASNISENPDRCLNLMLQGVALGRHIDLLGWLQGDFQDYVPHKILIAGWGNFDEGNVRHDVLSSMAGVRSYASGTECLPFVLAKLNECWLANGRRPCQIDLMAFKYLLGSASLPDSFNAAMQSMRSAWVHGMSDLRGKSDSLYVFLRPEAGTINGTGGTPKESLEVLLPFIDTALRQISQLPQQQVALQAPAKPGLDDTSLLSERETQIMAWVAMGKTNLEIGSILGISGFTVKNHMQRIFQKLNVFNRAQAVSKVTRVQLDV